MRTVSKPSWVGCGTVTAPEESSQSQVGVSESRRIRRKSQGIRRGLIVKRVPWILRQTEIGRTEAGEDWSYIGGDAPCPQRSERLEQGRLIFRRGGTSCSCLSL